MTDLLFTSTGDVADIWLLGTSYALKFECLTRPDDAKRSLKRRILLIHYSICALLLALWILRLCLNIAYTVRFVEQDDLDDDSIVLYYNANKVEETFNAVFFLAALELLIGSIWALVKSRGRGQPLKVGLSYQFAKTKNDVLRPISCSLRWSQYLLSHGALFTSYTMP